jgi:hypothetical protein
LIMLEFKGPSLEDPISKFNSLQQSYDKLVDQNVRKVGDL